MRIEDFIRKQNQTLQLRNRTLRNGKGELPLLVYPSLEACGLVGHGFTTRQGGVSEGMFSTLNLSFTRGDRQEAVLENYARLAEALGVSPEEFVCSDQTHTTNVVRVGAKERGIGVTRPKPWTDVDGMITNEKHVVLSTFYADCVPLFFVDPVHEAIGLSHSGWKGTVGRIGKATLEAMYQEFGTSPEDVLCAIGPSICQDCYEVSADVAERFMAEFAGHEAEILLDKKNGKYQLDLWKTNEILLLEAGIRKENLSITDVCTCCNPALLFSHRASKGKRGNLGAFLYLK